MGRRKCLSSDIREGSYGEGRKEHMCVAYVQAGRLAYPQSSSIALVPFVGTAGRMRVMRVVGDMNVSHSNDTARTW